MDHDGRFEREGRPVSQVRVDGSELCDILPSSEALTAQMQNLNETKALSQNLPLSQHDEGLIQKTSLNNNGKDEEEVQKEKEAHTGRSRDEDEDIDEVMKEDEEEEESEASSSLICCQSPEIPMTDSSYSETGSLLETPYPFSPGTSPEPTSPVISGVSPETLHPISSLELSQSVAEANTRISNTGSDASATHERTFTTGQVDLTAHLTTAAMCSGSPAGPASDRVVKDSSAEQLTSSKEPGFNGGSVFIRAASSSETEPVRSTAVTFTLTELTRLDTSTTSAPAGTTTEPLTFTTGHKTTGTEFTSITSPLTSDQEQNPSTSETTASLPTCSTGSVVSPSLLEYLEHLAQREDNSQLPQYLHQIAEAFVLQKDYHQALWFVQLERLYHQRVLDNLKALQEQWENLCGGTSSDLTTHHLGALKHICQTHSQPRTRDAECAVLDILRPKSEGGGSQRSCSSTYPAHQVEGGMEQGTGDSSCPVIHSSNFPGRLDSLEKDREDPSRESEERGLFCGSKLTEKQGNGRETEGGEGCTISVTGNGLHPSPAEGMVQSSPAEQQGEDLGSAREKEAKGEKDESDIEEATEALEMEDEGAEDEGEEKQKGGDAVFCQKPISVETLVRGAELEEQQLQLDGLTQKKLRDENQLCQHTQQSSKTCLNEKTLPPEEARLRQQEQCAEEEEEEEEEQEEGEEYDPDPADMIREAPSLDDMAKLITVEEISPASGLVSILKKRSSSVETLSTSASSEPRHEKPTAKRRVRFKVPDDGYETEVGGGDSCLLLFLLCLVTVIISIGGTALYCALGNAQSSVCEDFSRNADFYLGQIHRGIAQIQHWFAPGL